MWEQKKLRLPLQVDLEGVRGYGCFNPSHPAGCLYSGCSSQGKKKNNKKQGFAPLVEKTSRVLGLIPRGIDGTMGEKDGCRDDGTGV